MMPYASWTVALACLAPAAAPPTEKPPVGPFCYDLDGEVSPANLFCVSRDGKRMTLGYWDVWDIPNRKRLLRGRTRGAWSMAYSPNRKFLAVGGNWSELFVYHADTGKVYWNLTLTGHGNTGVIHHVEFTSDGKHLVSMSSNGMLRVWDVAKKAPLVLHCFPSAESPHSVHNGYKEELAAWRTLAGDKLPFGVKTFVMHEKPINGLFQFAIHPDGKSLAVAAGTREVRVLDLLSGKVLYTLSTGQVEGFSVRYSPDGKLLAVGGGDGEPDRGKCTIELWDTGRRNRIRACKGHRQTVMCLAFSPDGKTLASGGLIDGVRVWDVATGKQKYALHQKAVEDAARVQAVGFLPDGKTLLTLPYSSSAVFFWEGATGKAIPLSVAPPKVLPR